ncbi:hypothetical protein I0600191H4_08430 [Collinsella sp. i06-0019-1H4]
MSHARGGDAEVGIGIDIGSTAAKAAVVKNGWRHCVDLCHAVGLAVGRCGHSRTGARVEGRRDKSPALGAAMRILGGTD